MDMGLRLSLRQWHRKGIGAWEQRRGHRETAYGVDMGI